MTLPRPQRLFALAATVLCTWYATPIFDRLTPRCEWRAMPFGINRPQLTIGCGWVHWYTNEPDGFWSTQISLRPPMVSREYLSNAWSDVLKDDRAWNYTDPEAVAWKSERQWIKDADKAKSWTFPDYYSWGY